MYIVGIDIAKRKHEAAVIDGDGAVIIKPFSFENRRCTKSTFSSGRKQQISQPPAERPP